jgi:hypothetical protein
MDESLSFLFMPLATRTKREHIEVRRGSGEMAMIRTVIEDMAALLALGLFTGMVTVWAQALQGL